MSAQRHRRTLDEPINLEWLDRACEQANRELAPLRTFVLPGGSEASARLHLARTVCRRAERRVVSLNEMEGEAMPPVVVVYLNRLSDLLFTLARVANRQAGAGEVTW